MTRMELRKRMETPTPSARARLFVVTVLFAGCGVDDRVPSVLEDSTSLDNLGGQAGASSAVAPQAGSGSAQGGNQTSNGGAAGQPDDAAMGGNPAAAGAAGAAQSGASGASAAGSAGECSPDQLDCTGSGVALSPVDGWVTRDTNGLGVHGSFYVASDGSNGGPSTVTPTSFAASGVDNICVQGVAGPIGVDAEGMFDFAGDWGVLVGLNLSQLDGGVRGPWSQSTPEGVIIGFSYVLTGTAIPSTMRFSAGSPDGQSSYCVSAPATSGAPQTILFQNLVSECWAPGLGTPPTPTEPLGSLQWDIPAGTDGPSPFDFCITQLQGIVQ